jgi:hypothetical protein
MKKLVPDWMVPLLWIVMCLLAGPFYAIKYTARAVQRARVYLMLRDVVPPRWKRTPPCPERPRGPASVCGT